ncbi:hypothetical protein M422DRAFT_254794 [Sphaerobolus stellatus SS14]|uniref:Uncharacterized protein n=1 Tax=Sphaerobolus stellatus (strain SS14) TaxID=990650 RepID=A0A0C9VKA8_SPHS4|nr:hypothetical protein M422DRAFT_254794 [Sphaerobolus stellatus SS14]
MDESFGAREVWTARGTRSSGKDVFASAPKILAQCFLRTALQKESQMVKLRAFIIRHPKLESVYLDRMSLPEFPPHAVPHLSSLDFDRNGGELTYRLPQLTARNIRHFVPKLEGDQMLDVLKDMNDLRSCQLSGINDISKIHQISPHLERLSYNQTATSKRKRKLSDAAKRKASLPLSKLRRRKESRNWLHSNDIGKSGDVVRPGPTDPAMSSGSSWSQFNMKWSRIRLEQLGSIVQFTDGLTHLGGFLASETLEVTSPTQATILKELVNLIPTPSIC